MSCELLHLLDPRYLLQGIRSPFCSAITLTPLFPSRSTAIPCPTVLLDDLPVRCMQQVLPLQYLAALVRPPL